MSDGHKIVRQSAAQLPVTATLNDPMFWLPAASLAAQTTAVVPIGKALPAAGVQRTVGLGSQASAAATLKFTVAPAGLVQGTLMPVGILSAGPVVSRTVTVNEHRALFLNWSVATQVTVVSPNWNRLPGAGLHVTVTGLPQRLCAGASNVTGVPRGLAHSTVRLVGQMMARQRFCPKAA
jgi:hypothetical protein